jgi:hypothetical protein
VPRLWASRRIAELIDLIRQAGAPEAGGLPTTLFDPFTNPRTKELAEEILRLSTEFGILTEYTAFLATEGTDLSDWDTVREVANRELSRRAVQTRSGRAAISQSLNNTAQKAQAQLDYRNEYLDEALGRVAVANVQQVADRAFYKRGNRWIDGRLVAQQQNGPPQDVITFGSAAYDRLLRQLIADGRQAVLSLSGEIVLQLEDRKVLIRNADAP